MADQPKIRDATERDIVRLQDIARRTISASYRSFLGDEAVESYLGSGASDEYVAACIPDCRVLEAGGVVVGFCVCKAATIDLMMVDHVAHRRGHGSQLLRDAERRMFLEHEVIVLESFEDNAPTNAFYRANDWIERERRHDDSTGIRKIVFEKRSA